MTRLPDWRPRLIGYLNRMRREPFAFGAVDCSLFAAGAVEAVTGEDPAASLRGTYSTMPAGLRRVREAGYLDHVDMAQSLFDKVPLVATRMGDLAVIDDAEGPALGVVGGSRIFVCRETGLGHLDLFDARVRRVALKVG